MTRYEVRVVQHRPLRRGDEVSFFYPSTKWEMAQPFDCGVERRRQFVITEARTLDEHILRGCWLSGLRRSNEVYLRLTVFL